MRVLVTNDDGIRAPGLMALRAALLPLGEVLAIAPEGPRSACGHAITLHKPLRLMPVDVPDGGRVFAINGFPADCVALGASEHLGGRPDADCVALGASEHLGGRPDIVVSGINVGPNLGVDMVYSGTVAAAREAAICGISSFAISIVAYDVLDFGPAAEFALELTRALCTHELPTGTYLNVNVPAVPRAEMKGVAFTRQSRIRYDNRIERRTDPRGGTTGSTGAASRRPMSRPSMGIASLSRRPISMSQKRNCWRLSGAGT